MSNVFNENVTFNSSANFFDTVNVFGKLEVIRDITVYGNSDVIGNSNITGNSNVTGSSNVIGNITAASFIKSGGISNQFLKADGSVDATTYLTGATVGGTPDNVGGQLVVRNGIGGFSAGIVTATTFVGNGTIPIGGIIMWSGTIANIPTGWALCNGSNGTPDLRSRFIVGAGTDTQNVWGFDALTGSQTFTNGQTSVGVNSTGGRIAHQLITAELAAHGHSYTDRTNEGTGGGTGGGGANTGTQTLSKTTGDTGGNQFHENRPPYYALAFIMRTS
jgi:microcystin-dependent protein